MVQCRGLIGPWHRYTPDESLNIIFLESEGIDWYKYRESVTSKYLLMLDDRSVVLLAESEDKAQLFPEGLFTLEVDTLPEDWEPLKYTYGENGYALYERSQEDILKANAAIQEIKLKKAASRLVTLHGLVLAEVGSEADFQDLKTYIQHLKAVDLQNPKWPSLGINIE